MSFYFYIFVVNTKYILMNRTISSNEHYVQIQFYQQFIKDKQDEIQKLKDALKRSTQLLEKCQSSIEECHSTIALLKAKLEVSQQNRITL